MYHNFHCDWNGKMRAIHLSVIATVVSLCGLSSAWANEALEVPLGQSSLLHLQTKPAQVVIGNPAIADVTVQSSNTLVLFGKYPGGTSMTMLDAKGNVLMETTVVVTSTAAGGVTVHYGTGKNWVPGGASVAVACSAERCSGATAVPSESIYKTK